MPQPTSSDLHIDTLLTNISIRYMNTRYIGDQLFPMVPVQKQSDIITKYNESPWFRDEAKLRAPGTKSEGGGWTVDLTDKYFCDRYSYRKEVADETRDNADQPFNLDREATEFVTDRMMMRREVAFATDFFKTGVWGTDETGAAFGGGGNFTQWSDYGNSTPLVDLTVFKDAVEGKIALEPNYLAMGKQVWLQLKWHPDLIDTIKYTQRGQISEDLFAALAEFEKVLIGRTLYTTTAAGTAESSMVYTRIWGKGALMLYRPPAPALLTPSAGYTFVWQRIPAALQYIKRMRDEEREVDIFEGNTYFDQKAVSTGAGLFMATAVA